MHGGLPGANVALGVQAKAIRGTSPTALLLSTKPFAVDVLDLCEHQASLAESGEVQLERRRRRGDAARRAGTQRLRGGDEARTRRGEERACCQHFLEVEIGTTQGRGQRGGLSLCSPGRGR